MEANFRPARKAHPALRASGEEELEALAERLGEVRWDSELPGFRRFYVDDPFGNRIELLAALAPIQLKNSLIALCQNSAGV